MFKDLDFLHRQHRAAKKRSDFAGKRIGIYSGTFNPVHAGHIAFAVQALSEANLDQVVFLPERQPRHKTGVEHFGHRVAMLNKAVKPHPALAVLELVDKNFTVHRTLPQLKTLFHGATLVMLMGSDTAQYVPSWPYAKDLLKSTELVVGVRSTHQSDEIERVIRGWTVQPARLHVLKSFAPDVSSSDIRQALRTNGSAKGLLASVRKYARREWLYASTENL
ncbi:MAG TPA: nicotinate-nicotinamide nucleotide adenylyltransferase [Candidatus Saccharimonadales bacterium]|nr:nicotinate-nicotinamide nucleotide adenylyltransferase [Candidatus Saccharimonadales bacterium]